MDNVQVLDLGTSGCRGTSFQRGIQGRVESKPLTAVYVDQRAEMDTQAVVKAAFSVLEETARPGTASGLFPSTILHTLLLIDSNNQPLAPMSIWADRRAEDICSQNAGIYADLGLYQKTGCPLSPAYPLYRIMWHRTHEPNVWKKVARIASMKSYLMHQLAGVWAEDWSVAAGSGLLNIHSMTWEDAALNLAGIRPVQLPELAPPTHAFEVKAGSQKFVREVFAGSADGLLAHVGSAGFDPGSASITIGTSGAVRVLSRSPLVDEARLIWSYPLEEKTYVCGRATNNGGNVIEAMLGSADQQKWRELDARMMSLPADNLLFSPFMFRERTPSYVKDPRPFFFRREPSNEFERVRGVVAGIVFHIAALAEALFLHTDPPAQIALSGSVTELAFVQRLLHCVLGLPMTRPDGEAVLVGGARLIGAVKAAAPSQPLRDDGITSEFRDKTLDTYREWKKAFLL